MAPLLPRGSIRPPSFSPRQDQTKCCNFCEGMESQESQYLSRKRRLHQKHPNLAAQPDYKRWRPGHAPQKPRLARYEFRGPKIEKDVLASDQHLRHWLGRKSTDDSLRTLFILEGFNSTYEAIFGAYLQIHPKFWARHERVAQWETNTRMAGNVPPLPSAHDSHQMYLLEYCQMMHLGIQNQTFTLRCAENERHIASSRYDGEFDGVGSVYRKVSFWAATTDSGGWTALLLVDGPFTKALSGSKSDWQVVMPETPPIPFQGGYADFLPLFNMKDDHDDDKGPPRTSLFDDLQYYLDHHLAKVELTANPRSVTVFVEKIVASEYMLVIQYYHKLLSHLYWLLSRRDGITDFQHQWVTQSWSDLMALQRRLQDHQANVKETVLRLCSDASSQSSVPSLSYAGWKNVPKDFAYIEGKFAALVSKADNLVSAFNALSSGTAAQQSLNEATMVRFLTLVGMTFLPLSLIAGVFSMSDEYAPGGPRFWIYFAVGIPLTTLVYLLAGIQRDFSRQKTKPHLELQRGTTNNLGTIEAKPKRRRIFTWAQKRDLATKHRHHPDMLNGSSGQA